MRQIAATSDLVCTAAATRLCAYLVAALCRTNSNQFEFVRQIAATKFCRSDNYFHMSHGANCCSNLTILVPLSSFRFIDFVPLSIFLFGVFQSQLTNISRFS